MSKEFKLSDYVVDDDRSSRPLGMIDKGYVKDFIELLKNEVCICEHEPGKCFLCTVIDELAGDL